MNPLKSILTSLVGRKPPEDRRNMNEDWRAGDLAVCVKDVSDWGAPSSDDPVVGELLRVAEVYDDIGEQGYWSHLLSFVGKSCYYDCTGFRKVRPDSQSADTEFTAQIKRLGKSPARVGRKAHV